ncbi:MAG: hypothetical protein IKA36_02410, partial [Clostridia bacterium]|nr:hypothetical protein [Clostridia bacterium]
MYINGDATTFVLDGGTISGSGSVQAKYGGGIWNDGIFIMLSGTITECSATYGGAIFNNERMLLSGGNIVDCIAEVGDSIFNGSEMVLVGQSDDYSPAIDAIRNFLVAGTLGLSSGIKNVLTTNHTNLTEEEVSIYLQLILESIDAYWSKTYSIKEYDLESIDDQLVDKLGLEFEILETTDLNMIQNLISSNITTIFDSSKATQLLSTNLSRFGNELVISGTVTLASNTFEKYNFDRGEPVVIDGEEYSLTVQYRNAHVSHMGILNKIKFDFADYAVDVGTYAEFGFDKINVDTTASRFFTHYLRNYSVENDGTTYSAYNLSLFNAIDNTNLLYSESANSELSFEPYNFALLPESIVSYVGSDGGCGIETTTETIDLIIRCDLDDASTSFYQVVVGTLIFIQDEKLYINGELVISGNVTDGYLGFDYSNGYYWVRYNGVSTIEIYAYCYYKTTINIQYIDVNETEYTQYVSEMYLEMGITAYLEDDNARIERYDGQEIFNFNQYKGIDKDVYEPFVIDVNGESLYNSPIGEFITISGATTITIVCKRIEVSLLVKYVDSDNNLIRDESCAPIYCGDRLELGFVNGVQYLLKNGKTNNIYLSGNTYLSENTLGQGIHQELDMYPLHDWWFEMGGGHGSYIDTITSDV